MDLLESTFHYIQSMPEGCDIIITVGSEANAGIVREYCKQFPYNFDVRVIENRDVMSAPCWLVVGKTCSDTITSASPMTRRSRSCLPQSIGDGFAYKMF